MINSSVNEIAQRHFTTIATAVDEVLEAIEADLATVTAPNTAILTKYPEFGKSVAKMLDSAEEKLKLLQAEAQGASDWAEQLGYI